MLAEKLSGAVGNGSLPTYIEDVFSTYLYTGNGSVQTITNGIDLAGKGGMVWTKGRSTARDPNIVDTVRGGNNMMYTDGTGSQFGLTGLGYSAYTFGSTGYTNSGAPVDSENTYTFASWTFRKQPKFFDVVTYTGNGTAGRTIAHSLGSVPGCIIVKCTSNADVWPVYHQDVGNTKYTRLDSTAAPVTSLYVWNNTSPTSTVFTVGDDSSVNQSGYTYVAYIFAHNAGGFGLTGTDNVISCGSYTGTNATQNINLGYEPQFLMVKNITTAGTNWFIMDTMRGLDATNKPAYLYANSASAENASGPDLMGISATGFVPVSSNAGTNASGSTYIYIAIRRGPMKVPTDGTKVFSPIAQNSNGTVTTNFPVDLVLAAQRNRAAYTDNFELSRLTGNKSYLLTNATAAEVTGATDNLGFANNTGYVDSFFTAGAYPFIYWNFKRAPSFFDEVCYTGTGTAGTQTHNLGVAPEFVIIKKRSAIANWAVGVSFTSTASKTGYLNSNADLGTAAYSSGGFLSGQPTATTISVGTDTSVNASGDTYVAYLFASCAGVSKVGSYTGNGSSQTINCGFTGGARFILIKRTDSAGDWYIWDTARGIVSGNDPHLSINGTAAEVTTDDTIDPDSSGFIVNQLSATNVNVSSATYIYLAIA